MFLKGLIPASTTPAKLNTEKNEAVLGIETITIRVDRSVIHAAVRPLS
jgi:hypothetical protein